jgi:hypothetical protein
MPTLPLPHPRALRPEAVFAFGLMCTLAVTPTVARAQRAEPARLPAACDYRACAYNIIAALHGLKVTRGEQETPVATLGFLWTRDISDVFEGEGEAAAKAAVRTRRWGALFTDLGLALLVTGAASAATNDLDETSTALMLGGATSLGLSVPIQFAADKHLARAVWQHNARYATGATR